MVTFGQMFGSVIFLPLADRYGRKKIMISVGFSMFLVATLISLSPNYYVYIAMKFLTGATLEVSKNLIWIIKKNVLSIVTTCIYFCVVVPESVL